MGLFSIWKTLGNSRGTERLVPPARTGDACPPWTPPMSCLPPPHRPTPIAFRAVTTSAPAATKSRLPLLRWRWLSPPLHLPPSIHDSLFLNSWYNSSLFSSPPRTGGRRGRVRAIGAASRPSTPWSPRPAPTPGRDRAHLLDQLQRSSCAPSSAILGSGRWPALCCEPREAVMPQATGGMYADAIDHSRRVADATTGGPLCYQQRAVVLPWLAAMLPAISGAAACVLGHATIGAVVLP